MKKARRIVCIILALSIVFGCAGVASAKVAVASIAVTRLSDTSGQVTADVDFTATATTCSCKIVLQEKYNGSWRTATGIPTTTVIKNAKNTDTLYTSYKFTLKKGKVYRAKVTFTDKRPGITASKTYYSAAF